MNVHVLVVCDHVNCAYNMPGKGEAYAHICGNDEIELFVDISGKAAICESYEPKTEEDEDESHE